MEERELRIFGNDSAGIVAHRQARYRHRQQLLLLGVFLSWTHVHDSTRKHSTMKDGNKSLDASIIQ